MINNHFYWLTHLLETKEEVKRVMQYLCYCFLFCIFSIYLLYCNKSTSIGTSLFLFFFLSSVIFAYYNYEWILAILLSYIIHFIYFVKDIWNIFINNCVKRWIKIGGPRNVSFCAFASVGYAFLLLSLAPSFKFV